MTTRRIQVGTVRGRDVVKDLSELKSSEALAADDTADPEVAAELQRTAVANQLAILVIRYRADHGLTQTALARILGMKQPAVARLEAGDHEPTLATLARIADKLGISIRLDIEPTPGLGSRYQLTATVSTTT